jgi:hypothetical protein
MRGNLPNHTVAVVSGALAQPGLAHAFPYAQNRVPRPSRVLCERAGLPDVTIPSGNLATMISIIIVSGN